MKTFKNEIKLSGIGIHSGTPVNVKIKPSKNPGIFFQRTDLAGTDKIAATYDNVGTAALRNTTIGDVSGAHVQTIEHLMATLFILGIDSAIIEIDAPETPIMDGSAYEFYKILQAAETVGTGMMKIIVKKEISVRKKDILKQLPIFSRIMVIVHDLMMRRRNNGFVKLSPNNTGLVISATMDYPDAIIGRQSYEFLFDGTPNSVEKFITNIARARTFGRVSEWEYLKSRGMGRGASESNVIALNNDGSGTINKLLFPNEFVRHQIIDAMGDMFTSGGFIYAKYESYKGGHAMNNLILKKLFSDTDNYDIIK